MSDEPTTRLAIPGLPGTCGPCTHDDALCDAEKTCVDVQCAYADGYRRGVTGLAAGQAEVERLRAELKLWDRRYQESLDASERRVVAADRERVAAETALSVVQAEVVKARAQRDAHLAQREADLRRYDAELDRERQARRELVAAAVQFIEWSQQYKCGACGGEGDDLADVAHGSSCVVLAARAAALPGVEP